MNRVSEALSFPNSVSYAATIPVKIVTNPLLQAKISVDGQSFNAPTTVMLSPGQHSFSAISKVSDLYIIYGFDNWQVNGKTVSYMATTLLNITGPCTVTAQYMLAESGINAPIAPDSIPAPNQPLSPNLILDNSNAIFKEV